MRFEDEYDESGAGLPVAQMAVGVSFFVLIILALVLYLNREPERKQTAVVSQSGETAQTETQTADGEAAADGEAEQEAEHTEDALDRMIANGTLTADDLDWDMYPEEEDAESVEETEPKEEEKEESDPSTDGKHTLVIEDDGTEKWVPINPYIAKHEYDYGGLVYRKPIMSYYEEGRKVSYTGISISKYNEFVDYTKLKKAGIDFAMIRVGARGYSTGQITLDENFDKNMKDALGAGMQVGVYFFSQAVTAEEAIDEAGVVLAAISEYNITYPVVFDMEYVENDTARVEALTRAERTEIADAFLSIFKEAGYNAMLYADKEWLINKIDLTMLSDYDVWLYHEGDVPDYPYKFTMWQYTKNGKVDGMAENAELTVSFIDYENK